MDPPQETDTKMDSDIQALNEIMQSNPNVRQRKIPAPAKVTNSAPVPVSSTSSATSSSPSSSSPTASFSNLMSNPFVSFGVLQTVTNFLPGVVQEIGMSRMAAVINPVVKDKHIYKSYVSLWSAMMEYCFFILGLQFLFYLFQSTPSTGYYFITLFTLVYKMKALFPYLQTCYLQSWDKFMKLTSKCGTSFSLWGDHIHELFVPPQTNYRLADLVVDEQHIVPTHKVHLTLMSITLSTITFFLWAPMETKLWAMSPLYISTLALTVWLRNFYFLSITKNFLSIFCILLIDNLLLFADAYYAIGWSTFIISHIFTSFFLLDSDQKFTLSKPEEETVDDTPVDPDVYFNGLNLDELRANKPLLNKLINIYTVPKEISERRIEDHYQWIHFGILILSWWVNVYATQTFGQLYFSSGSLLALMNPALFVIYLVQKAGKLYLPVSEYLKYNAVYFVLCVCSSYLMSIPSLELSFRWFFTAIIYHFVNLFYAMFILLKPHIDSFDMKKPLLFLDSIKKETKPTETQEVKSSD